MGSEELLIDPELDEVDVSNRNARLARVWVIPPFSILDSTTIYWKDRKKMWLGLGIRSELGRGEVMAKDGRSNAVPGGSPMPIDRAKNAAQHHHSKVIAYHSGEHGKDPLAIQGKFKTGRTYGEDLMRGENEKFVNENDDVVSGTSIFDPVLCEIMYRWFAGKRGRILDPFAGGSVRGIVAGLLGHRYMGLELRVEQVKSNREQWSEIATRYTQTVDTVRYHVCDTVRALSKAKTADWADFVFTCPPYAFLERYSDDPSDLSTMDYKEFLRRYRYVIKRSAEMLKPNRFACFVVGDVRDPKNNGVYLNFVGDTVTAFQDAGMFLYNQMIFCTPVGSLQIRVGQQMRASAKIGYRHQHVLVFVKGDPFVAVKDMPLNCTSMRFLRASGIPRRSIQGALDQYEKEFGIGKRFDKNSS